MWYVFFKILKALCCAQTWVQKFDYCKMAENVFGDISENLNLESENSEVNEALDDDTIMEEVF